MSKKWQVPFLDSKPCYYPPSWDKNVEWKDNYVFSATMQIIGLQSGQSAKHLILKDENNIEYVMFVKDLIEALKNTQSIPDPEGAKLIGNFTFVKRGQNYGIKFDSK